MAALKKFMVVHVDPKISWGKVEENWRKLANVESAQWERTYFNKAEGIRYCVWHASSKKKLSALFKELDLRYESIILVEETVPDVWGTKWQEHLEQDKKADTLAF